jgi:hypothetical protein
MQPLGTLGALLDSTITLQSARLEKFHIHGS